MKINKLQHSILRLFITINILILIKLFNTKLIADPIRPVVGGVPVQIGDYPYQVSLQTKIGNNYYHFCGGSIISENWILSAAHCVPTTLPEDLYIRVGFTFQNSGVGQIFQVDTIIIHPDYNSGTYDNDIALIKLKTNINFNNVTASIVRLANSTDEGNGFYSEGTTSKVTGWGHTSFGGSGSNQLLMGEMQIYSNSTVMNTWGTYFGALTSNMMTAGIEAGGVDACQGDSGGPLVVEDVANSEYVQVGIVSWGDGCADYRKPGVYTKVSRFINWINSFIVTTDNSTDLSSFPNNGDGNGDGIVDTQQLNVTTIPNFYGNGYITIVSNEGYTLNNVTTREPFESESLIYPFGIVEFKVNSSNATIKLYYHGISDLSSYSYRKLRPNNNDYNFSNAEFSSEMIGGQKVATVTLKLTDGGLGDYDGIVNGIIHDPGGPAILASNIPTLSDWARGLLVILVVGFGIYRFKRNII